MRKSWKIIAAVALMILVSTYAVSQSGDTPPSAGYSQINEIAKKPFEGSLWGQHGLWSVIVEGLYRNPRIFCPPSTGPGDVCAITGGVNAITSRLIQIMVPFYVVAMMFCAIFFILKSGSARGRARARSMFLKLLWGMVVVTLSPAIYQMMLDIEIVALMWIIPPSGVTLPPSLDLWLFRIPIPVSPFVGLRLADMEPGGFLAGIGGSCIVSCCTFVTYVVSALLTWARNFLVFFYGVFFPIITFFYFFDLTKPYGRKWVQDAIKWIFLPIVQALILAFTLSLKTSLAATPVYIPGDVFSVFSPMMSTGVVLAGMLGFIAAPIIIGQLMSYIGTAISSIGLSTGRTWLVSAGGIMHGGFSGGPAQVAWAHAQMARDMSKNRLESSLAYSAGGQAYSVRPSAGGGGRAGAGGGGGGPAIGGGVAPGASGGGEDYGGGARGGGGRSGGRGGAPSASGGQGPIAREAGAQSGSERAEAGSPAAPGTQPKGDQYGFPSLGTMLSDAEYKGEPEKPKLSGTRPGVSEDGTELPFDDMLRQARGEVAGERQAGGGGAAQGEAREVQEEGSRFIQQRVQQKVPEATGTTEPLNLTDKVKQGKVIVEPTKYRTTKEDTGRTKAAPSAGGGAGVQRWAREKTEADNEAARSMEQAGVEAAREQGARDKEAEVKKEQAGIRAAREQGKKKEEAEVKKGEQDKKTANEEQKVDTKAEREK